MNSKDCIIEGSKKLIAIVGIEDTLVVDSNDVILICAKNATTDIKKVFESLKMSNREEYI